MIFRTFIGPDTRLTPLTLTASSSRCCTDAPYSSSGLSASSDVNVPYIIGYIKTVIGDITAVSTELSPGDTWRHIKARTGSFRMSFSVRPGLYAAGNPGQNSDVFVSANYGISFNKLRSSLKGRDSWILVLDTGGINVWCAAAKGTFGTVELLRRIELTRIAEIACHGKIIVPQLGAPGIDSGEVMRKSGFRVMYGPVRAADIGRYIENGYKADTDMREVTFGIVDRLILTPVELYAIFSRFPYFVLFAFILFGLTPEGIIFRKAWSGGYLFLGGGFLSVLSGAFLTPVLLPFIPFRAFSVKGWISGVALFSLMVCLTDILSIQNHYLSLAEFIFFPLISSYLALQFTGAATFTNISGVRRELKYAIPAYITGIIITSACLILYKISDWGLL